MTLDVMDVTSGMTSDVACRIRRTRVTQRLERARLRAHPTAFAMPSRATRSSVVVPSEGLSVTLRSAGRAVLAMVAALVTMLTMALAAAQPARADAVAAARTAAKTPDGTTGGAPGDTVGGTSGGANFRLTGHVDLNKYSSVGIRYIADDGSLAVVDASSGEDDVEHLLVTLDDVSITDLDDSYGSGYIASHDGKRLYYADKDDESVRMMDVSSKKTTTLTGLDWDEDSYLVYASGDRLLVSSVQGDLRVYDVAQRKETVSYSVRDSYSLGYDDDLSTVYVIESDDDGSHMTMRTLDAARGGKGESKRLTVPDGLEDDLDEAAGLSVVPFAPSGGRMMLGVHIRQDAGVWATYVCSVDVDSGKMTLTSDDPGIYLTNNRRYLMLARADSSDLDDAAQSFANGKVDDISALEVWDSVSGRMVRQLTDHDAMQDIIDRVYGREALNSAFSSDGRYLLVSTPDDAQRSRIAIADLSANKTEEVELPESDDVSFGKDGFGGISISADSGTLVAVTDLPDGQSGKRLMIYSTGIGGSAWANPTTLILIGVGVAAVVGVIVAILLVARARRRRRAMGVSAAVGVSAAAGMPNAPASNMSAPNMTVPGVPAHGVRSVPVTPPMPGAGVPVQPVPSVPSAAPPVPVPPASNASVDMPPVPLAPSTPSAPASMQSRPRFCTQCGAALPDAGVRFCPQCGSAL